MQIASAVIDLSLPPLAPSEVDGNEVPRHQPPAQPSEGQVGSSELKGPPVNRLKLVFNRGQKPREVLPTNSPARRTARTVRQPSVPPTAEAPSAANQQARGSRKKDTGIVCAKCNRGHSPGTNMIVFCDACNRTWHQKCHDPPIDDEVVRIKEAEWLCSQCKPEPKPASSTSRPAPTSKSGRTIHPRLQQAPCLDVGGNQFSPDETRAYLSSLSHAALVELVVNVSSQNPAVAMFPANMRDLPATSFPVSAARLDATATTTTKQKKRSRTASAANDDPSEDPAMHPSKRTRTTSAPVAPRKRTRAASTAIEQPVEAGPARKRARTTSAPAKPSAAPAPPKSRKPAKSHSRTTSTSSRRQASAQPPAPKKSTTRSKKRSAKPRPPSRGAGDTSTDDSEPKTLDTSDEDLFDPEDHRSYPEAGKGYFPSTSDPAVLDLLKESPDCQSISHSLHGRAKIDRALGRPPRVWGSGTSS